MYGMLVYVIYPYFQSFAAAENCCYIENIFDFTQGSCRIASASRCFASHTKKNALQSRFVSFL
jgi:hypothetical protein